MAAPLPDTVSDPPRVVVPLTVRVPPDTLREFPLFTVRALIVSEPLACATARPELIRAVSAERGRMVIDQLPGVSQVRPPAALVKVLVLPAVP